MEHIRRPLPNAILLAGFAAMSGVISLASVHSAIRAKFSGKVADGNIAAATAAFEYVKLEKEEYARAEAM
jgi:pyruvate ferredoxin oxidoreductase gamma subunit